MRCLISLASGTSLLLGLDIHLPGTLTYRQTCFRVLRLEILFFFFLSKRRFILSFLHMLALRVEPTRTMYDVEVSLNVL